MSPNARRIRMAVLRTRRAAARARFMAAFLEDGALGRLRSLID
jgi:hypothetical protein